MIKHTLRPDQQRLAREDMALHPATPEDREALVGAAKKFSAAEYEAAIQSAVRELRNSLPNEPSEYGEWRAQQDRILLVTIIRALTANPKLAAEIKIILRGDKP